jgi:hypothetical protein
MVRRTRPNKGGRIAVSCVQKTPGGTAARFGEVARAHWGVENGLHWVLDVTMNEDQARNHKDHGPQNIALLRRLALNLAKLEGSRASLKSKLFRAALSEAFLTRLLAQFGKTQMR